MPKENARLQSWRIFFYARKYLGRSTLYSIFGKRHARTVDLWCEDPRFTDKEDKAFDPVQGVHDLLTLLDDHGHCGIVRSCIAYLISGTSAECGIDAEIVEIKPTITEEILADFKAVAALASAIEAGLHPDEIAPIKIAAMSEIERTYAKYHKDFRR